MQLVHRRSEFIATCPTGCFRVVLPGSRSRETVRRLNTSEGGMAALAQLILFAMLVGLLACVYPFPPFRSRGRAALFVVGSFAGIAFVAPTRPNNPRPAALPVKAGPLSADWVATVEPPAENPSTAHRDEKARLPEGRQIPRSSDDRGRYFLLSAVKTSGIVKTLHKRVGVDSVGWTSCEIDCKARRMRETGYSEDGPDKIRPVPTRWFELVPGSSKSDLVAFVCK